MKDETLTAARADPLDKQTAAINPQPSDIRDLAESPGDLISRIEALERRLSLVVRYLRLAP